MLRSWVEVDFAAIRRNVKALARLAAPGVKIMAVVKADAYGHGAKAVTATLAGQVAMFGVANFSEAEDIQPYSKGTPICLLSGTFAAERAAIVQRGFIPVISSFEEAEQFAACASGKKVHVHLAVDTGMGRLGVSEEDAVETARKITALPGIALDYVGSHLPVADEDAEYTRGQLTRFKEIVTRIRDDAGAQGLGEQIENSAGLLAFPESAGSLVRLGLALYGESPLPEFQSALSRALTWKTRIVLVRDLGAGRGVSYGRDFITPRPMRVATLAVGYTDGYPRQISGKGAHVIICGQRCPVLGRLTMDQCMVDVSGTNAVAGDEVVLIGSQENETVSATDLAGMAGTIAWDIFTGIGPRVARVYQNADASASQAPNPA